MRALGILTLTALFLPPALAACADTCKSCGWYCNQGCDAALDRTECDRCLYCRRESSSCGFIPIGDTWTHDPPADELCAACEAGCWCGGDWYCMDNVTGPPPPHPTTTRSRAVVLPTGH
ncbi:hypothetical protein GGR52DRAFT_192714 [Hypoxylon sp. FL1284]|nr:hypothetical protein GGR52DRAFT_192714 [Hypoxylon sp. FL1284]